MKCLLCGYTGDSPRAGTSLACCSWCTEEAASLHPDEEAALVELECIAPAFQIWKRGCREESGSGCFSKVRAPIPQPALIYPGLPLYIGDMDDAMDIHNLQVLGIGCVVNLCADMLGGLSLAIATCQAILVGQGFTSTFSQHVTAAVLTSYMLQNLLVEP